MSTTPNQVPFTNISGSTCGSPGAEEYLVFREMVNFSNTKKYLATQMINKTSFKQHNKEWFIIMAGVKEWEWESVPFVSLVSVTKYIGRINTSLKICY